MTPQDQIVSLISGRLNFSLLGSRVVEIFEGNPPSDAIAAWRMDVTRHQSDEGVSDDGVFYIGAFGILLLIDFVAKQGMPARTGKVIWNRILKLFPGSAEAPAMISATVAAALEHPGSGGEHSYFTACALRQMQNFTTDTVEVEIECAATINTRAGGSRDMVGYWRKISG